MKIEHSALCSITFLSVSQMKWKKCSAFFCSWNWYYKS